MSLIFGLWGTALAGEMEDPYIWLEEVEGAKALAWVEKQNEVSLEQIKSHPSYKSLYENSLAILNDKSRIPHPITKGNSEYLYNFWKDETHVRGIFRRTTQKEYKKENPRWETILDIDELAKKENENWVYKGMNCLRPTYLRCMVSLSRGGADAVEMREFDIATKSFVKDGFFLPEAKSIISWINEDQIFVGTDFGEGSLTDSGYPRIVKQWSRGTPLTSAKTAFEVGEKSVGVWGDTLHDQDKDYQLLYEYKTIHEILYHLFQDNKLVTLDLPIDSTIKDIYKGNIFVELKSDWKGFKQGQVIYSNLDKLLVAKPNFETFFEPTDSSFLSSMSFTKSTILVTVMNDVKETLYRYTPKDGDWIKEQIEFDPNGSIDVLNTNRETNDFYVYYESFLEPETLYTVSGSNLKVEKVKAAPHKFDSSKYISKQHFAISKDGTKIPYFLIMAKDAKLDGKNPTLLYGYGGFEISLQPSYSATIGKNWLEQGGIYVLANIRGGGEYGPKWHQAALKQNRHKAYEDFEAIAEDLINRNVTSPKHLGIHGGSNGGLLVGATFTRRADLYNAVICQVPLLDMKRYNKLLAGASWMGEFGDPDIAEEWDYIKTYSPYHNVAKTTKYPKVFFTTSTRDDRVHPGHARKMVAKMKDMGHDVLYFENMEGGHAGAANNEQRAMVSSLAYAYLLEQLSYK
ncbi:prolyl oligopeptidase family serine peptidase [Thalassotalea sp. PS06]|uniref:prolyl oligopeptidase family serine peptidase n=1 Tax=Thalassotalea sp. PS06 TaxID=2594005 RepID=UPI001165602A|nr:prolyl oligopeptidase family serine peptidase [Thalassotalea sp. PS06]QDP02880.1 S9 family peptidase [Thalassotalea sp. PS06]